MGIERFLNHRASITRQVGVLDDDGASVLDDDGQPTRETVTVAGIRVGIQPRSTKERTSFDQAGVTIGTHRIYSTDRRLSSADALTHDPASCPMPDARDLPLCRFELHGADDAAGAGHHLEIDAVLIGPAMAAAP